MNLFESAQCFEAPAKLNLFLHIVGQREDGYHLLETQFQLIDLCDEIYLQPRLDGQIVLHTPTFGQNPADDLTVKAAQKLKEYTGTQQGADIGYKKRIPVGAGLGGGSSDAATTLIGLNSLWQTKVSREDLQKIALQIGADVPFFVFGRNAFASGVGEELVEINQPVRWYVVVYPKEHVSTKEIFLDKSLTRDTASLIIRNLDIGQVRDNDMQDVVVGKYPVVAKLIKVLSAFGSPVMTGSGSCVFLEFESEEKAQKVFQEVSVRYEAYCVKGLEKHKLFDL